MEIIGRILKENRIRKNLTVHEIAVVTKINSRIIKAIEEGNLDELPSKSFLRGFIRSYAAYLELDVDEILKTFHEELGSTLYQPSRKEKTQFSKKIKKKKKPSRFRSFYERSFFSYLLFGGLLVLLTFLTMGIKNLVEKYKNEGRIGLSTQMLENVEDLNSKGGLKEGKEGGLKEGKEGSGAGKEESLGSSTFSVKKKRDEDKKISQGALNQKAEKNKNLKLGSRDLKQQKSDLEVSNPLPIKRNTTQWNEIILEAFSDSIKVQLKNIKSKKVKELFFSKGETHVIKFKDPLQIKVNRPKGINIIYNGRNTGPLLKRVHTFQLSKEDRLIQDTIN